MKLLRYGTKGREKPGLLDAEGRARSLAGVADDIDASPGRIAATSKTLSLVLAALGAAALTTLAPQGPAAAQTPAAAPSYTPGPHPYAPPKQWGQNDDGMHVFIWAGLKTHFVGQHDYPQFLADWSKILETRGAVVDGALHAPSAQDLRRTDVLIIYKGDAGFLSPEERKVIDDFVRRGGGIVSIHDSLCGPDPADFAKLVGAGKKHGEVNYTLEAPVKYTIIDKDSPLMKSMSDMTITDEAFFKMTWADNPKIHVLATAVIAPTKSAGAHAGEVVPQIWTYEHALPGGRPARAFVWMQGHMYENFTNPKIESMLLRGIAWAGKHPVDELIDYKPPADVRPLQLDPRLVCDACR